LTAKSLDLADGETLNVEAGQCLSHYVELKRLYDGHDEFHSVIPLFRVAVFAKGEVMSVDRRISAK
jgi:hypothetical protein